MKISFNKLNYFHFHLKNTYFILNKELLDHHFILYQHFNQIFWEI